MLLDPRRKASKTTAFMLLETVVALGIVAFALVPMIGLLPIGMNHYRNSVDRTLSSRIVQQIAGEFALGVEKAVNGQVRYFDSVGQETSNFSAVETIYTVSIFSNSSTLPGDQQSDRSLTRVNVEIWYNPAHVSIENRTGAVAKQNTRLYSFEVCY